MGSTKVKVSKVFIPDYVLTADILSSRFSYFLLNHRFKNEAEWLSDEAIIELHAQISGSEGDSTERIGQTLHCSLTCSRSFKSCDNPLGNPAMYSINFRKDSASFLAYLPADAFWAIQGRLEASRITRVEISYKKPVRSVAQSTSLYLS